MAGDVGFGARGLYMARGNESKFAAAVLGLLLFMAVFYGCRAFDPEPVLVNTPPDTFITGAPAETTGTVFRRHMYWYGNDVDGAVVQFIFAITDSTVRDLTRPDIDEEDARFDPADDILTLTTTDWRTVGYTDKTDSVFVFTIDRLSNTAKDITFHVVAVDDRGTVDPTPARLHFFNNSLGNPVIRFSVSTFDDSGVETERWVGTALDGPKLEGDVIWPWAPDPDTISPEDSAKPIIGFLNHFQICWEASSPNGTVVGYRYLTSESPSAEFLPVKEDEESNEDVPDWTLDVTCFDFQNDTSPDDFDPNHLPDECASEWKDCPELVRWTSGEHKIRILALDEALVQNGAQAGELRYQVNYPPETELIRDSGWPRFSVDGVNWTSFVDNDTIPDGAYVLFKQFGLDRFERNRDNPLIQGLPCCDDILEVADPDSEVRYQTRIADARAVNDLGARIFWKTSYSPAEYSDTLGFHIGPFDYTVTFRSQDEHLTEDTTPDQIQFTGGFQPKITSLSPSNGDSLLIKDPLFGISDRWPGNSIVYTVNTDTPPDPSMKRFWDGAKYVWGEEKQDGWWGPIDGLVYRYRVRFDGQSDVREPNISIRSWTYEIVGQYDPENRIKEGAGRDIFDHYSAPGTPDFWEMSADRDGVVIFIPRLIWQVPDWFKPGGPPPYPDLGQLLARQLGRIKLKAAGKTVQQGDEFAYCFIDVRESCDTNASTIQLASLGRRTENRKTEFAAYLGFDPGRTGSITELWPPEGFIPEEDR